MRRLMEYVRLFPLTTVYVVLAVAVVVLVHEL